MNIAIFGAGVAGLSAAVALTMSGHSCRVYERQARQSDAGMAFILMPEGRRALRDLGIGLHPAENLRQYRQHSDAGDVLDVQDLPPETICIRRSSLIDRLVNRLPVGSVRFDCGVEGFDFDDGSCVTRARMSSGGRVTADLYIAADGLRSVGHRALYPDWLRPQARVLELVGLAQSAELAESAESSMHKFFAPRGGLAFGLVPVDPETVVWYLQFDSLRYPTPDLRSAGSKWLFINNLVGHWGGPVSKALSCTRFENVHLWRPIDADIVPEFHRGNLALIGDAAHPFLPFASQGTSAAILDAICLSESLAREPTLREALREYGRERRADCLPHVDRGRLIAEDFVAPAERAGGCGTLPLSVGEG